MHIVCFFAQNIYMIWIFSLITGFINGLFASGAGQILVFCLIFILKFDTHSSRATSVFLIGTISIYTLVKYLFSVKLQILDVIIVCITGIIFGTIGAKISKKMPSKYLNLISGMLLLIFSTISLIMK